MASGQSAARQKPEGILEFMARRYRETDQRARQAEAAAYEAVRKAIRSGQDLRLPQAGDVVAYGRALLEAKPATQRPSPRGPKQRRQETAVNPKIREAGGRVAQTAGTVVGLATGVLDTAKDAAEGARFVGRLVTPGEAGREAWRQVGDTASTYVDYGRRAVADPSIIVRDVGEAAEAANRKLNPVATAAQPTLGGEARRRFEIGQNQGEFAVDVASLVGGRSLVKSALRRPVSEIGNTAKYLDEGYAPGIAAYLAEKYVGRGHHAIIPQRAKLPDVLGGGRYPDFILESPFNLQSGRGMSRGQFYKHHAQVDPFFYGTNLPNGLEARGWSSKRQGIDKYELPERLWFGTPAPVKGVAGGSILLSEANGYFDREEGR